MWLVGDKTVALDLSVDLILCQFFNYLWPFPLRPEEACLIEYVRPFKVVDSLIPATTFQDLTNNWMIVAGIVSIKFVEKGLCNVTSGSISSNMRIFQQVGYLDAVVPSMHVELLVNHTIDQTMYSNFLAWLWILCFQERQEVGNILFGKFSWKPKYFCQSSYFVVSFNRGRNGGRLRVHLISQGQLYKNIDRLTTLVELFNI